jgi:arylsulfatase A-like enzyme
MTTRIRNLSVPAVALATFVALLGVWIHDAGRAQAEDIPNVILILIDSVRPDHLGCYGYDRNTSPHIDEFASEAILFRNAIASAPWSTPSVASILTGHYPHILGIEDNPVVLNERYLFLAEVLRAYGYRTKAVISDLLLSEILELDQGFDSYDQEEAKGPGHVSSPGVTEKATEFVRKNRDSRFFLFLHYADPRPDYVLHEAYDYYPAYDGPLKSGQHIDDIREQAPDLSTEDVNYIVALYDSEISFADEYIGSFLDNLKEIGLYDDSFIIITANHGQEFMERGDYWIGNGRTLYRELIRVPLITKLPRSLKGRVIEEGVGLVDLNQTIITSAGLKIPEGYEYDGQPLSLSGDEQVDTRPIFVTTEKGATLQAVIKDGWKLIFDSETRLTRLYNLAQDPAESKDVASSHAEKLREMETLLYEWDYSTRLKRSRYEAKEPRFTPQEWQQLKSRGYLR